MRNLKDQRTKIFPSTTRGGKELPSSSALDSPSVLIKLATPTPAIDSDMSHVIDDATSTMNDAYDATTLLLNTLLQILSLSGVVELTTQLPILVNILWLPLCRNNKFGLNTLPSKTVAIPYTCGLSRPFSGAVAGEHRSFAESLGVYIC
jgi:hypothetical protein